MKKLLQKQIGTEINESTMIVDDFNEDGEIIGNHEETVRKEVPIYQWVYEDETEEEKAIRESEEAEYLTNMPKTTEERLSELEAKVEQLTSYINELGKTELVGDGSADKPFTLTVGMTLVPNAYYNSNGIRYVYMGEAKAYDGSELTFENGWTEF